MLRLLVIIDIVLNVTLGLALWTTRGAATNLIGVPSPLPFYAGLLAIFLVSTGLAYIPAIRFPETQRFYLWVMGVGVKFIAASQFIRLWVLDVAPAMAFFAGISDVALGLLMAIALLTMRRKMGSG